MSGICTGQSRDSWGEHMGFIGSGPKNTTSTGLDTALFAAWVTVDNSQFREESATGVTFTSCLIILIAATSTFACFLLELS